MRKYFPVALAALFTAVLAGFALAASMTPTVVVSGQEHWTAGSGMLKGVQVAVLAGNPSKSGLYIVRLKLPAGTVFPVHYHNETEDVSVVSGTLWVGVGDKVNAAATRPLTAGSFVQIPAKLHHYAITKTVTVIDRIGMGPASMIAVKT
ncbi:MAG TPA: cupin domain-containing protein [Candidatus Rubrimentiphilum sp.]|nr:cupin domain-containing protein [Candidatus Rubrimentiphilum sp.]